jgi:hypothetical protein
MFQPRNLPTIPQPRPSYLGLEATQEAAVANARAIANARVLAIAPEWKQVNLLREVGADAPEFALIDAIRAEFRSLEAKILASKTVEECENLAQ